MSNKFHQTAYRRDQGKRHGGKQSDLIKSQLDYQNWLTQGMNREARRMMKKGGKK